MQNKELNLTMIMDLYELTMSNGIFTSEMRDTVTYFDMFFRRVPDDGGYAIMAGLEQLIEYMNNLRFSDDDIKYLEGLKLFSPEFIEYLRGFKFTCDVWAMPEGTVIAKDENGNYYITSDILNLQSGTRTLPKGYEVKKDKLGFAIVVPAGTKGILID